ncbi:hypothetical protein LSAJ160_120077 [Latilactobacillus sakei]|nr:hypothetical protein LSAJ160_120077 [Latilactobacillus sakei]
MLVAVYTAPTMAQARVQIEAGLQSVADPQSFSAEILGLKVKCKKTSTNVC